MSRTTTTVRRPGIRVIGRGGVRAVRWGIATSATTFLALVSTLILALVFPSLLVVTGTVAPRRRVVRVVLWVSSASAAATLTLLAAALPRRPVGVSILFSLITTRGRAARRVVAISAPAYTCS